MANNTKGNEMKTSEPKYGSYGSGIGTYVIYLALSAVIMLVIRWVSM